MASRGRSMRAPSPRGPGRMFLTTGSPEAMALRVLMDCVIFGFLENRAAVAPATYNTPMNHVLGRRR